jgi:thiol-disulfide isomerase/thioredoxin
VDLEKAKDDERVVVVEFWATWCPPCRKSIPHLTALQKKYKDKDVTIVGVSTEPVGTVAPFVEEKGDKMGYTVAVDKDNKTSKAYMEAFDIRGIPHAFIIDREGRIAWHTNPLSPDFDKVLEDVIDGSFDLDAAKRDLEKAERAKKVLFTYFGLASVPDQAKAAREVGDQILAEIDDPGLLNLLAWNILSHNQIPDDARDFDLAAKASKRAMELTKEEDAAIIDTYAMALSRLGEKAKAIEYGQKAVDLAGSPAQRAEFKKHLDTY